MPGGPVRGGDGFLFMNKLVVSQFWSAVEPLLKEQCHEDFAVLGQFCAKIIALSL